MQCNINENIIKESIEDAIANLAVGTGLFKRVDNNVIAPIDKEFTAVIDDTEAPVIPITPKVEYDLDTVKKLESEKGMDAFAKGKRGNWTLEKILTEAQIQKSQKELILELGLTDRKEIINKMVEYTFSVEINISRKNILRRRLTEDEESVNEFGDTTDISNTEYYSNLTVPGGTNYTENEISTPYITPSIKGHAAFSTDKGIGWFRSDEKAINQGKGELIQDGLNEDGTPYMIPASDNFKEGILDGTKTRRILEVQSDLFQKGRDREDLISPNMFINFFGEDTAGKIFTTDNNITYNSSNPNDIFKFIRPENAEGYYVNISVDEFEIARKEHLAKHSHNKKIPQNQFLQLLNKDNNWVTFFVKAIIQDSAKKGYEKVLFPKGNTANKVEGQETLEQFISTKQERLDYLQNTINSINSNSFRYQDVYYQRTEDENGRSKFLINDKEVRYENWVEPVDGIMDRTKHERDRIEQELKEASEGKHKFIAINKFYEDTIYNVLKKQGYEPTSITDEYNNGWYEVSIASFIQKKVEERFGKMKSTEEHQDVAQQINDQYSTQILKDTGNGVYLISVPDELVKDALRIQLKGNPDSWRETMENTNKVFNDLYKEAGITEQDNPVDFFRKVSPNPEVIDNVLKVNPGITIGWTDGYSLFDPISNVIAIGMTEVWEVAQKAGMPYQQALSIMIEHELGHARSFFALETGRNSAPVDDMLQYAVSQSATNPFVDHFRQGFVLENGMPYAFKDIHEFVAEAFSNPYFQTYLKNVRYKKEGRSLWDKLIDFVRSLFGLGPKDNMYDTVIDYINSQRMAEDNYYGSEIFKDAVKFSESVVGEMQLFYRGNPKNYVDATNEYFTDPSIKNQVLEAMKSLPSAIIKLKAELSIETNRQKRETLQSLLNAYNEVKGNEKVISVYVNMLVSAARIAKDIDEQLRASTSLPEDKRIHAAYSAYLSAKGLEFISPTVTSILAIMDTQGYNPNIGRFVGNLRAINSVIQSTKQNFVTAATPAILQYYSSLNVESPLAKELQSELDKFTEKRDDPATTESNKRYYQRQIDKVQKKIIQLPTTKNFEKIFNGEYVDSSSAQMNFEAIFMNSHPLIYTTASKMKDLDIEITQDMLNIENDHQKAFDKVVKGNSLKLREPSKTWSPIYDTFKYAKKVEEDENGKLKTTHIDIRMLSSQYSPEYLQTMIDMQSITEFYYDKMLEARRANDDKTEDKYYTLYTNSINEQKKFHRENSELKYLPEVYEMFDLLDKELIKDDGSKTFFRKERGDIFHEIEHMEKLRDTSSSLEEQRHYQQEIDTLYVKMREIRSSYDEMGKEKTQFEAELAKIANEYYELRNKYGEYVLTPEGQASFEREMNDINDRFKNEYITKEQRDALISSMTVTETDEKYFEKLEKIQATVDAATTAIMDIPEVAEILKGIDRTKINEGYKKIRQLTSPFRDNEKTIDGILFSKVRPDLVKEVKSIQQEVENLKNESGKLKGLSIQDTVLLKELIKKYNDKVITEEEKAQMFSLQKERAAKKAIYKQYKKQIDAYHASLASLTSLTESNPSKYYIEEKDNQLNILMTTIKEEITKEIKENDILEGGKYYMKAERWYKSDTDLQGMKVAIPIVDEKDYSAEDKIVDEIARERASKQLVNSEWWRTNHYTAYSWNNDNKGYSVVEYPIYIWVKTEPKDKNFIKEGQPSIKFKTFKIHDGSRDSSKNFMNPEHKEILPFIPINKRGRYESQKYNELKNSSKPEDQRYFNYLEFLRAEYGKAQEFYPPNQKMGDILPGIFKTNEEIRVQSTNAALKLSTYKNLLKIGAETDESEDTKLLLGGSQSKYYSSKRVLPTRFTGKIDASKQSADIPGMILAFTVAAKRFNKYSEIHPVLESLRIIVQDLPVQESVNLANKLSVGGIFSAIKSQTKQISRAKQTDQTNLAKTIDYVLDTFLYEERKTETTSTVMGMQMDWQKASTNLKRTSSLALFSLKMFIPIKNTISAKIQSTINANFAAGFYTKTDYGKAQQEAISYTKDNVRDYKKFGDKSFIGQAIQYFQVLNGVTYNEYGKKTQWTEMKNAENYLTLLKNISEFELQLTQFLAMSRANKVELDGQMVPFLQAYEINKDGNLALKTGAVVTKDQEKKFIKRIAYINRMINGAYRQDEKNAFQKNVLGDLAFYLNGFVVPGITNRFSGTRYSVEADVITRGYWSTAFTFMKDLIQYEKGIREQWDDLTPEERGRVLRFVKELGFIIGFMFLALALGSGDDKKDLKKNSAFHNYMLALTMAVKSETETFTPLPGFGLNELARKMNSPFAAVRQIANIVKVLENGFGFVMGDEDAFYKKRGIKDGFHDKGDAKVVANFLRLLGYTSVELDPLEKVSRVRQAQQLR